MNTSSHIRKFLWDDEVIPISLAEEIMQINQNHFVKDQFGLWKIYDQTHQEPVGYTGLWYFFEESQPQLLYAILENHIRQGYASEAAKLVINYAFDKLGFQYLIAATDKDHLASQEVAKRLGMIFVEERLENDKPTHFYRIHQ